jgi:hypothetical protein
VSGNSSRIFVTRLAALGWTAEGGRPHTALGWTLRLRSWQALEAVVSTFAVPTWALAKLSIPLALRVPVTNVHCPGGGALL